MVWPTLGSRTAKEQDRPAASVQPPTDTTHALTNIRPVQSINQQSTNKQSNEAWWLTPPRQIEISPSLVQRVAHARRNLTIAN